MEKQIFTKLYQINHLLLTYQSVSVPLFHLIRLFSFLQIIFNLFYGVNITNDFLLPDDVSLLSFHLILIRCKKRLMAEH
jgi:hypothetical protein